jgi:hypothetical protein
MGSPTLEGLQALGKAFGSSAKRTDDILRRVAQSRSEAAMLAAARQPNSSGAWMARDILSVPGSQEALGGIDDILARHQIRLGDVIGRGGESIVLAAQSPDGRQVVKLSPSLRTSMSKSPLPPGVPGVAGYSVSERVGPMTVAVQRRADHVMPMDADGDVREAWRSAAHRVMESLSARRHGWIDMSPGNVGVFGDELQAIDGYLTPLPAPYGGVAAEDAIRALRVRPDELRLFQR